MEQRGLLEHGSKVDSESDSLLPSDAREPVCSKSRCILLFAVITVFVALLLSLFFRSASQHSNYIPPATKHTTIVVSLDGFRHDYYQLLNKETSAIVKIGSQGVHARRLQPIFPSLTFPNHYTIATGLYAESHGIVDNEFCDPIAHKCFSSYSPEDNKDEHWWLGEPIWTTATLAGKRVEVFFWVGSEAPNHGVMPYKVMHYNGSISFESRVDTVLQWLSQDQPDLIMLYISEPDSSSHKFGPEDPRTIEQVHYVDGMIQRLMSGIDKITHSSVDLIVLSDHGLATVNETETINLDVHLSKESASYKNERVTSCNPLLSIYPSSADMEEELFESLNRVSSHLKIYRRDELPERFHYHNSLQQRIPPLVGLVDEGWSIASDKLNCPQTTMKGYHGFDNTLPEVAALFVATGPSFKKGVEVDKLLNVDVYGILCRTLGVTPAPNNGTKSTSDQFLLI